VCTCPCVCVDGGGPATPAAVTMVLSGPNLHLILHTRQRIRNPHGKHWCRILTNLYNLVLNTHTHTHTRTHTQTHTRTHTHTHIHTHTHTQRSLCNSHTSHRKISHDAY